MRHNFNLILFATLLAGGLSGCGGEPEWVAAYEDCKQQMTEAAEQMKAERDSDQSSDPQAQAMMEAMSNMAMAMGMAACESIKQMCEPAPDSDACQAIVQEYKQDKEQE